MYSCIYLYTYNVTHVQCTVVYITIYVEAVYVLKWHTCRCIHTYIYTITNNKQDVYPTHYGIKHNYFSLYIHFLVSYNVRIHFVSIVIDIVNKSSLVALIVKPGVSSGYVDRTCMSYKLLQWKRRWISSSIPPE